VCSHRHATVCIDGGWACACALTGTPPCASTAAGLAHALSPARRRVHRRQRWRVHTPRTFVHRPAGLAQLIHPRPCLPLRRSHLSCAAQSRWMTIFCQARRPDRSRSHTPRPRTPTPPSRRRSCTGWRRLSHTVHPRPWQPLSLRHRCGARGRTAWGAALWRLLRVHAARLRRPRTLATVDMLLPACPCPRARRRRLGRPHRAA
jgi:hypothetical protein